MHDFDRYIPFTARPPSGTRFDRVPYHDANGRKKWLKRLAHPFDQSLADRRYWGSLFGRRQAHVTAVLTVEEQLFWSTTAPYPEAVLPEGMLAGGRTPNPAVVATLFESGYGMDPQTQTPYCWGNVSSMTDAGSMRFGGFLSLVAPQDMRLRLATQYSFGDVAQYLGTVNGFVVQYGAQLRAANPQFSEQLYYL